MKVLIIINAELAVWLSEVSHPYWHLTERGVAVDFASPTGCKLIWHPLSDPYTTGSLKSDDLVRKGFLTEPALGFYASAQRLETFTRVGALIGQGFQLMLCHFLRAAAASTIVLAGCSSTMATAPLGSRVSANDLSFVTNLYNIVDFDREITTGLLAKGPDPRVAALARDFVAQGDSLIARVAPIAAAEGILPPGGQRFAQRADLQVKIASVMGSRPIDYDQEYLADEVYSHEQALQSARAMANQSEGSPQLMAASADATKILEVNLSRLRALQLQLLADVN